MPLYLFNVYEWSDENGRGSLKMNVENLVLKVDQLLCVDNIALVADSEKLNSMKSV